MPAASQDVVDKMGMSRRVLLQTRGLMGLKLACPKPALLDTFVWHLDPTTHPTQPALADHLWFIDGSLIDSELAGWAGRLGFGVVVVARDGELVGAGSGCPPAGSTTRRGPSCGHSTLPRPASPPQPPLSRTAKAFEMGF